MSSAHEYRPLDPLAYLLLFPTTLNSIITTNLATISLYPLISPCMVSLLWKGFAVCVYPNRGFDRVQ